MNKTGDVSARACSGEALRALMEWAAGVKTLPDPARRRAALILSDNLGALVAASAEPEVAAAHERLMLSSGKPEATIFATGAPRADRFTAASANGMAATWCELDEGFRSAPCHAGAYLLPALLAEAEARNLSATEVLRALAVAYEITGRLAVAFPFRTMTVHPHAAFATIGAAAGAGVARRQDAATLLGTVAGAASMTFAGPFRAATDGALVRNAWTSAGAWIGLRAAEWAEAGIAGIAEMPYDVFVGSFGTQCEPDALTRGLGEDWAVGSGYHKIHACCQYAHSAIEASLALHARLGSGRAADQIAEILVETHPRGLTLTPVEPDTVLAAKFSMPHAAAASARLGTGGQRAFSAAALQDASIADLRRRVRVALHPAIGAPPFDRPARVTWKFRDGEEWSAACESARGGADQPFDEPVLMSKHLENTGHVFPRMTGVCQRLIASEEDVLTKGWRGVVTNMLSNDA